MGREVRMVIGARDENTTTGVEDESSVVLLPVDEVGSSVEVVAG